MPRTGKTFTVLQRRVADEYLKDFKITRAAIRAGCEPKSASKTGWAILQLPHVKEHIAKRLKQLEINGDEITKMITNIAKGNLADYFSIRKVEKTPRIRVPLSQVIKDLEGDIAFEVEYSDYAGLNGKERRSHDKILEVMRNQLLRYQMQLERARKLKKPEPMRIVSGEPELVDEPYLDVVRILEDKERGIIKSVTPTEFGLKIEMYGADTALLSLAKINGLFAADNNQRNPAGSKMDDDQFSNMLKEIRDAQKKTAKRQ